MDWSGRRISHRLRSSSVGLRRGLAILGLGATLVDPSTGRVQRSIGPCELRRHQEKPGDEEDDSRHDRNYDADDADCQ